MKATFIPPLALCLGLTFGTALLAQEPNRPAPPRPDGPPPSMRGGDRDRRLDRGDRDRVDRFRGLPPEERQQVREAFEKVWKLPEVEKAREGLRIANEAYRKAIEEGLKSVDPEAAKILERNRPAPPHHQLPIARKAPESRDASAIEAALGEIEKSVVELFEQSGRILPAQVTVPNPKEVHQKTIAATAVAQALKAYKQGEEAKSGALWNEFRKAYLDELIQHLPRRPGAGRPPHPRGDRPDAPPLETKPAPPQAPLSEEPKKESENL